MAPKRKPQSLHWALAPHDRDLADRLQRIAEQAGKTFDEFLLKLLIDFSRILEQPNGSVLLGQALGQATAKLFAQGLVDSPDTSTEIATVKRKVGRPPTVPHAEIEKLRFERLKFKVEAKRKFEEERLAQREAKRVQQQGLVKPYTPPLRVPQVGIFTHQRGSGFQGVVRNRGTYFGLFDNPLNGGKIVLPPRSTAIEVAHELAIYRRIAREYEPHAAGVRAARAFWRSSAMPHVGDLWAFAAGTYVRHFLENAYTHGAWGEIRTDRRVYDWLCGSEVWLKDDADRITPWMPDMKPLWNEIVVNARRKLVLDGIPSDWMYREHSNSLIFDPVPVERPRRKIRRFNPNRIVMRPGEETVRKGVVYEPEPYLNALFDNIAPPTWETNTIPTRSSILGSILGDDYEQPLGPTDYRAIMEAHPQFGQSPMEFYRTLIAGDVVADVDQPSLLPSGEVPRSLGAGISIKEIPLLDSGEPELPHVIYEFEEVEEISEGVALMPSWLDFGS